MQSNLLTVYSLSHSQSDLLLYVCVSVGSHVERTEVFQAMSTPVWNKAYEVTSSFIIELYYDRFVVWSTTLEGTATRSKCELILTVTMNPHLFYTNIAQ